MLGAGARDAEGVGFLEGVAADELAGDLAGERDDGDGIHHGIDQAGDQVGCAWAGGGAADAHPAGGARVAFRGEAGIFLVAHQHMAYVVVVDRIVQGQGDAAGIPEEAVHAFPRQTFQQHFRAIHQSRHIFLNKSCPKTKKATSRLGSPRWWPRNSSDAASSGAGYDDQYDNNDDYRYRQMGRGKNAEEPVCGTA